MTNFEKVAASPEALANLLGSLPMLEGPWDTDFCKTFCEGCAVDNCDGENCPHARERNNPLWWLMQNANE